MGKTLRFLEMPFLKPQTHMIYFYDKEQKKFKSLSFFPISQELIRTVPWGTA